MDELRFPVASFHRVFETVPTQEVLDLAELLDMLRRFEVKRETMAAVDRELARIERATEAVVATGAADGPVGVALGKVATTARASGDDVAGAVRIAAAKLADDARRAAKRDLRLWSPTLYTPGAPRGSEGVVAVGCLVLDYDAGTLDDAAYTWESWFHLVHSTWSHRAERPRFRVILPLARPVAAADWAAVWDWAAQLTGNVVDPALKGLGSMYALPAVPRPDAARVCEVFPGPFLDPAAEGLVLQPPPPIPPRVRVPGSATERTPGHTWVG